MKYRFCLFVFLLLSLTACRADIVRPQWRWERAEAGLPRQTIMVAVAADPLNPNHLWTTYYAPGGLATSLDGGQTWSAGAARSADNPVFDLLPVVSADHQTTLWAATRDGLLVSADAGASWQPVTGGLPQVTTFTVAANIAGQIYVGLEKGGIYTQKTSNSSWKALAQANTPLASTGVLALAVSPDGQFLYAGMSGQGIFASQDAGRTWINTYPGKYTPNIAVNPLNPTQAIASVREQTVKDEVLEKLLEDYSTRDNLVRTNDGGRSWHTLPLAWAGDQVTSLLWLPDGTLGAGTSRGQLFRSRDGGDTWQQGGAGLPGGGILDMAVAGPPDNPSRFLAATWTGLYASDDGGQTWRNLAPSLGTPQPEALLASAGELWLGSRVGLFRWLPEADQWQQVTAVPADVVTSLANDPTDKQRLYAAMAGRGIYRSDDAGQSWEPLPPPGVSVSALAVSAQNARRLYLLATWERPYESLDGGQTWSARWSGLGEVLETTNLVIDPVQPIVYVGTEAGLYRSYDNDDWLPAAPSLLDQSVLALLAQPATTSFGRDTVLYIGATRGVYRSLDGGLTVQGSTDNPAWGTGLGNISITALLTDPRESRLLYAGTAYNGVYQSADEGHTWQSIGPAEISEEVVKGMAWGPNGDIFIITTGGVWRGVRE